MLMHDSKVALGTVVDIYDGTGRSLALIVAVNHIECIVRANKQPLSSASNEIIVILLIEAL